MIPVEEDEVQLGDERTSLEARAAESGVQFFHFQPWIIRIEKDVRLNLELPFSREVTSELRKIITVFVEHIAEDLSAAPGTLERPVTAPDKLRKLQAAGEDILADLGPYAELADHYYHEEVERARRTRSTKEVSADIDTIAARAKELWKRIVKYLKDLSAVITDSYGSDEVPG